MPDSSPVTRAIFCPCSALRERGELVGHLLLGLVPRRRLAADERAAEPIGMVEPLQRGLAADAERAARSPGESGLPSSLMTRPSRLLARGRRSRPGTRGTRWRSARRCRGRCSRGARRTAGACSPAAAAAAGRHGGAGSGDDLEERPAIASGRYSRIDSSRRTSRHAISSAGDCRSDGLAMRIRAAEPCEPYHVEKRSVNRRFRPL